MEAEDCGGSIGVESKEGSIDAGDSLASFSHGGVRGPSSSSSSLTCVPPPEVFSTTNSVMTTFDGSMSPRSSTLPKSSRFASNAPENRLDPIAFPSDRPLGC